MEYHHISSERLTIAGLKELVDSRRPIALSDELRHRIIRCRKYISVGSDELSQLQRNLVMSHSCGTGEQVPSEIVRLMLLLKIRSLSYGYSGVRLETVERLVDFYNNDIIPASKNIMAVLNSIYGNEQFTVQAFYDHLDLFQDAKKKEAEGFERLLSSLNIAIQSGLMTLDEARDRMNNYTA